MKYSEIIRNPHFNNLAAIIRVSFDTSWQRSHAGTPFWTLQDKFLATIAPDLPQIDRGEVVRTFTDMIVALVKADDRLTYTEDDLKWFVEILDRPVGEAKAILHMLSAWWSAPDTMLTPVEVAEKTGTAESTWRNKAAAGEIPGAVKKGKQWLLPLSVLRSRGLPLDYE